MRTLSGSIARTRPLLSVNGLTKFYGRQRGCCDISFYLRHGEVLGIVGESGSGKSTLLGCLAGHLSPDAGTILYDSDERGAIDVLALSEAERRRLSRNEWGFVHQTPRDGLRLDISAAGNIAERPMASGQRHYEGLRAVADDWLEKVEIGRAYSVKAPGTFSGGMQQRLQIARTLVTEPRLIFMDEPTGGLDVSVQARLLDLLRGLVRDLDAAVIVVTHDLGVARLLADRLIVMQGGRVIEEGLTDQVLDDPHHAYTQLLVSSIIQA